MASQADGRGRVRPGQDTPGSPRTAGVSVCLWGTLDSAVSVPAPDAQRDGHGVCLPGRWCESEDQRDSQGAWPGRWLSAPFPVPDESACVWVAPVCQARGCCLWIDYAKANEGDGNTAKIRAACAS